MNTSKFNIYFKLNFCCNDVSKKLGGNLGFQENIAVKSRDYGKKNTNVVDLLNKVKLERKKEKRVTIVIASAAVSALAITGIIISL